MKNFMKEFKEFISRGNVMSMAIGIIIGSSFTAIVNALVQTIITPLIGVLLGGMDFSNLDIMIGEASIGIGQFVNAVITFLLTALVLFCIVKFMNALNKKKEEEPAPAPEPPKTPEDILLLQEIRDLLKEKNQ